MKTGIDPRIGLWFNFVALLLTGIAAGSLNLAGIPDGLVTVIKVWASNASWIIGVANMVFGLYSSTTAGPLISSPSK